MDEVRIWRIVDEDRDSPKAEPIGGVDAARTEKLLEDVLARAPEILMTGLTLVGRQNETGTGPLDLLGVDEDGRLVVFELKKGILRREAVAQVIDYASQLFGMDPDELNRHITESSGRGGTQKLQNFRAWYQENYRQDIADIGRPRMVLVGLGVDEPAKRMVEYLAGAELDISLISFYAYEHNGQTLIARQVEVASKASEPTSKGTKQLNQERLDKRLEELGVAALYRSIIELLRSELGDSVYLWPNQTGHSFNLPDITESGGTTNHAYLSLSVPDNYKSTSRIVLYVQKWATDQMSKEMLESLAKDLQASISFKPGGYAEIWLDGGRPLPELRKGLSELGRKVHAAWQNKRAGAEVQLKE